MIYEYTREEFNVIHSSVSINPGELWKNDIGYIIEVLDLGKDEIWCKWENGIKGSWNIQKFMDAKYQYFGVKK